MVYALSIGLLLVVLSLVFGESVTLLLSLERELVGVQWLLFALAYKGLPTCLW